MAGHLLVGGMITQLDGNTSLRSSTLSLSENLIPSCAYEKAGRASKWSQREASSSLDILFSRCQAIPSP